MRFTAPGFRPLLIEEWLPIKELGIESVRERKAASALPPLSFLHLWWARRPLAAAQGVQLAALLPPWDAEMLSRIPELDGVLARMQRRQGPSAQSESSDHRELYGRWLLRMAGILGDPVLAERRIKAADLRGERLGSSAYGYRQAYRNHPDAEDLQALHSVLCDRWGELPIVLDPTAGGGSIPFVSQRYGLPTIANDLNPVAATVLEFALAGSAKYGSELLEDLETWGKRLCARLEYRLSPFFQIPDDATNNTYLWVNTVACPRTGGPAPLAPNWWLDKKGKGVAVAPTPIWSPNGEPDRIDYQIVTDVDGAGIDPDKGTVSRGDGVSLWDGLVIDGDYIKHEAQEGRMWPELYAVACKKPKKRGRGTTIYFRSPDDVDYASLVAAEEELGRLEAGEWSDANILPDEQIGVSNYDRGHRLYGRRSWRDLFVPRQFLVHGVFVEEWRKIHAEINEESITERADTVSALLAIGLQGKALNWNSIACSWNVNALSTRSTFDKHNYSFKWTFAEFEAAKELWPWCLSQLMDAYSGIAELLHGPQGQQLYSDRLEGVPSVPSVMATSATSMEEVESESIHCVNIDPPYYDNVQYAELADFFYVWEKRTLGLIRPQRFVDDLTDKDNEAVANPARFADAGRRRMALATFDYQQKMQAIFSEARRVLNPQGVLIVWFTHKAADAWDVLGTALIEAGFTIETSWPVNTESSISLHQAKVNSAASTIILVCRKRETDSDGVFFEEIEADVRRAAVRAVTDFSDTVGVTGVDLQLSTYGPTLSVISGHWPVLSDEAGEDGRARRLRPEEALAVAREEVNRLVKSRLVGHSAQFDDATDFWLLCWANFEAREFPYDDARKLGMSTLDVDDAVQAGLVKKKAGKVELVKPASRGRSLRSKMADNGRFPTLVDALHHLLNSYRDDGLASTRTWLADSGYGDERAFLDTLQASVNAIPRVRTKKGLSVPEAQELEDVVIALFGDKVEIPAEVEEFIEAQQTSLEV